MEDDDYKTLEVKLGPPTLRNEDLVRKSYAMK